MSGLRECLTLRRIIAYLAGLMILSFGIAASVRSDLGSAPVSSVPYMFSLISHVNMGIMMIIWQAFLVLLQFLILRREFRAFALLQLVTGFVFGYFNSFALWVLSFFPAPTSIVMRLFCSSCGFWVGGFGVWLYSTADVINMPSEGIVMVIAKKLGKPFHVIKRFYDITSVIIAGVGCWIGIGTLESVGFGTVMIAVMVGTMVGIYERSMGKRLRSWLRLEK